MVWKFNNIEIPNVINADYDFEAGKITLECEAEGSLIVNRLYHVTDENSTIMVNDGQKINLGTFQVDYVEGNRVFIEGDVETYGLNSFYAYDKLNIYLQDGSVTTLTFGENNEITNLTNYEITDLLSSGENQVTLELEGTSGTYIGSSDINIIEWEGSDPRDTISIWDNYISSTTTNPWTIDGKRVLQATGVRGYKLEDFRDSWVAVLDNISFNEDSFSNKSILYKMSFMVGKEVFSDSYGLCYVPGDLEDGILVKEYLDDVVYSSLALQDEFGEVILSNDELINKVDIYGGAIELPSWVEVNGERKYWHYKYDDNIEKMTFGGINSTRAVITSPKMFSNDSSYYGSKINAICIGIVEDTMGIISTTAKPTYKDYFQPFYAYSNIVHYLYTNKTYRLSKTNRNWYNELGHMTITEKREVDKVVCWGNGCDIGSELTCNDKTIAAKRFHKPGLEPKGTQEFEFYIKPNKVITLKSSKHLKNSVNKGIAMSKVRVYYK